MRLEIFPTFSVYIHLHEFIGLDLVKGYYQIRIAVKPNSLYSCQLCREHQFSEKKDSYDDRHSAGCSGLAKIVLKEQCVELDNAFRCRINVVKRLDKFETLLLPIEFELWYLDTEAVLSENYRLMSKREVNIQLKPDRSTHCSRPIFFEYFQFSAVSITVHTSIVGLNVVRRKPAPDPPISDKLRACHRGICDVMFAAIQSLQNFVQRYSHVLTSPIKIVTRDCKKEEQRLQKELESSRNSWGKFEQDIFSFNTQLARLFNQLLQLFSKSKELQENMLAEFSQLWMKQLSEAFLFSEDSIHSLLQPSLNQNSLVLEHLKKNAYYSLISSLPVSVANADVNLDNMTIIMEQRFLPSNFYGNGSPKDTQCGTTCANGLDRNKSLAVAASPRKIFDFCLPLSALGGTKRHNGKNEEEQYILAPNRHLSALIENCDKRRMTDPGVANFIESTSSLTVSDHRKDAVNTKCHSLSEISLNSKSSLQRINCSQDNLESELKTSESSSTCAEFSQSSAEAEVNAQLVEYVKTKESFKQHLEQELGFQGYFYSDSAAIKHNPLTFFSNAARFAAEKRSLGDVHLVIFVHGLEGTSEDLGAYRNYLRVALPKTNLAFLLSEVNKTETWSDLRGMAQNLTDEILKHISKMPVFPTKISLIAHSLGGLIVRAMCSLKTMKPLLPYLHTLMTLNSPHCGLLYNQRTASWGISLLQWWKQSPCLEQLTFKDSLILRDNFLYRLSQNGALGLFKNVLLVGSCQDVYVPCHSALLEPCKAALLDSSGLGTVYLEMLNNINECVVASSKHTTVIKYTVSHCLTKVPRAQQVTGRAVHIAAVDDDVFVEKLLMVSAAKYFK